MDLVPTISIVYDDGTYTYTCETSVIDALSTDPVWRIKRTTKAAPYVSCFPVGTDEHGRTRVIADERFDAADYATLVFADPTIND